MTRMSSSINIPKKVKKLKRSPGWLGYSGRIADMGHEETKMDANSLAAGNFYGTGVRAKLGKVRTGAGIDSNPVPPKKLRSPPRSLV